MYECKNERCDLIMNYDEELNKKSYEYESDSLSFNERLRKSLENYDTKSDKNNPISYVLDVSTNK